MIVKTWKYRKMSKVAAELDKQRYRHFFRNQAIDMMIFDLKHGLEEISMKKKAALFAGERWLLQKEYHRSMSVIANLEVERELNKSQIEIIKEQYEKAIEESINEMP
jgi:hypothetical protein